MPTFLVKGYVLLVLPEKCCALLIRKKKIDLQMLIQLILRDLHFTEQSGSGDPTLSQRKDQVLAILSFCFLTSLG